MSEDREIGVRAEDKPPILSVIIPVYKTPATYLRQAIESVLEERDLPLELILVDDSPGAASSGLLIAYEKADRRVSLLVNDRNYGVAYSRNRGLEVAVGKYVAFQDSDDFILPGAYRRLIECAERERLDAIRGVSIRGDLARDNRLSEAPLIASVPYGELLVADLTDASQVDVVLGVAKWLSWSIYAGVTKRSSLKTIRFNECLQHYEDLVFNVFLLPQLIRVGFINLPLYGRNVVEGSLSLRAVDEVSLLHFASVGAAIASGLRTYPICQKSVMRYYCELAIHAMFMNRCFRSILQQSQSRSEFQAKIKESVVSLLSLPCWPLRGWTKLLLRYLAFNPCALFASLPVAYYSLKALMRFRWL